MTTPTFPRRRAAHLPARSGQRGALLFMTLIVLTVLFLGAVALARSFNSSLFTAGNMAFKRDLTNEAEWVLTQVKPLFATSSGSLYTTTSRASSLTTANYSAVVLPTNPKGVPLALLDDSLFATYGNSGNDITLSAQGITLRYLVERLCSTTGDENVLTTAQCVQGGIPKVVRGTHFLEGRVGISTGATAANNGTNIPLYRIHVRVTGPRNTQSFYIYSFSL